MFSLALQHIVPHRALCLGTGGTLRKEGPFREGVNLIFKQLVPVNASDSSSGDWAAGQN